ncbi:MAG TPA: hypothetical protein PJ982_11920, partial [Lacipirellulaceae bacterium]|nr:hypothetical protein [Lacipirellulaceae bacterium]
IDLRASGIGINEYFYVASDGDSNFRRNNREPILIMFAPEGRVSRVRFDRRPSNDIPFDQPVVDNIFLLVGRRELAPPPTEQADVTLDVTLPPNNSDAYREAREAINWLRGESRWIAIGSQSGRIVSVENAFVNLNSPDITSQDAESERRRNAQIQAARGFARQMSQLGGR